MPVRRSAGNVSNPDASIERMEALEHMAQGLAHDLNNALSPILGYAELLLEEINLSADRRQKIERIVAAVFRATEIPRKLELFYGRGGHGRQESVQLAPLVREQVGQLAARAGCFGAKMQRGEQIELELDDSVTLKANPQELQCLVTELVTNALEASAETPVRARVCRQEPMACLEVSDSGTGMPPEFRKRCIEPFRTSKRETGAGLGLSICYGIVRRLNGNIRIDSARNRGTVVTVLLPLSDKSVE